MTTLTIEIGADDAVDLLARKVAGQVPSIEGRFLVALAGAPASGKSTLARALGARLNNGGHAAALIPMDGFHLDNQLLKARGLLARKGAPETFDAEGFVHAIGRLRSEAEVILPDFDRDRDVAVAGAIAVGARHMIAVVEGNYLCFAKAPWLDLQPLWDFSVYLDVPRPILEARLLKRWQEQGLSSAAARRKVEENDLPNAFRVEQARTACDLVLRIAPAPERAKSGIA